MSEMIQIALKEWAVVVRAFDTGRQSVMVRKGGISEENRRFSVAHSCFLLFPTFEHQRDDLITDAYLPVLAETLRERESIDTVTITHWAEVTDVVSISSEEDVRRLSPFYIFTANYATERLRWKPKTPLTILLVRVYRLEVPQTFPLIAAYGGCKSWTELAVPVEISRGYPVLDDATFAAQRAEILGVLHQDAVAADARQMVGGSTGHA